jgi:hypothetical protein
MRLVAACLLVLTSSAAAAPAEETLEEVAWDPDQIVVGYAQLAAGGEGNVGTGAGVMAAVAGPLGCNIVEGGVHGTLRPSAVTGRADYSLCLSREFMTVVFAGSRGTGLAPGLDAKRSLWARRYNDSYDSVTAAAGEYEGHTILEMTFGHGETEQVDGIDARKIVTLDFDMTMYRYRRPETFSLETLVFTSNSLKSGSDNQGGVTAAFYPARLHVEGRGGYITAAVGWALSGGTVTESSTTQVNGETTSMWTETIDSSGLPQIATYGIDVEAGVERGELSARGHVTRGFYPTFDGNVAREARVSAELSYERPKTKVVLAPFAARTHTWTRDAGDSRDVTAGASLHVGRELTDLLRVDAIGEAGVSPYARLDRERLPHSSLGGQVLVALTASASPKNQLRALVAQLH